MEQENGEKLIWLLIGAALGASVALLYAPQSGERTRRVIGKKVREGREVLIDSGRELYEKGCDLYEKGRVVADEAAELFEKGRRIVHG